MNDLQRTLEGVISGVASEQDIFDSIDRYLATEGADIAALRARITQTREAGLAETTVTAALAHIDRRSADPDRTTLLGDGDDATQLRAGSVDDDRTIQISDDDRTVQISDDDRTVQISDDDRTVQVAGDDATVRAGDDDPFAMTALPDPPRGGEDKGPGSVLKGRFRLEQVIGQGGMGAVYKAVDLLKVEARDRNPYIAVKLLVGDFKQHPEAFISLQRESAKAQRLAHPNIATVYDFDRDGETVYMTMELMIGAELAKYIKKLPVGGLPVAEANRIIEQLCAGLQYAHARSLVHSDFKPGNAFLLEDGTVKLLDFGIARASKTKGDVEGESTVFDPGQLGALTPAYATIEMFEGLDPDPRDDIYALACVSYELYTGKHPFNKMSAVKAKEKGLKAPPIEKLTKRQNRTLARGLALMRDDRIGSVEEFWEGLRERKDYTWHIAGAAVAGVLLIGLLSYGQVMNFVHEREHGAIVMEIDSGDEARLVAALARINELGDARQRLVVERARERILDYFESRAEAAIDESQGRDDFPAALAEVDALDHYMPDSAQVAAIRQSILQRRDQLENNLTASFNTLYEEDRILPDPDAEDITEVVARLRVVLPDSPLLTDARLAGKYATLVTAAVSVGNWQRAEEILDVALAYAPRDATLIDLQDRVVTELRRQQEASMVASLRDTLREAVPQTLADFRAVREEYRRLSELRPDDDLVRSLGTPLRRTFENELNAAAGAQDWTRAETLLVDFATVLPVDVLLDARSGLTRRQLAAGVDTRTDTGRTGEVVRRIAEVRSLLAQPAFDDEFSRALTTQFKELTARLTSDTADWETLRRDIAVIHIERARGLIAENRFGGAGSILAQGETFHADLPEFADARAVMAEAERAFAAEQERQRLAAAILSAKDSILRAANAREVEPAVREFNTLRTQLPANDIFITTTGPEAIARAYIELATQAGESNRYQDAVTLASRGLQVLPGSQALQDLLTRYQNLARREQVLSGVSTLLPAGFPVFQRQYSEVRQILTGAEVTAFERDAANALATRMTALDTANQLAAAIELKALALQMLPGNQRITSTRLREPERPSQFASRIRTAFSENKLTEARQLLVEGQRAEPNHSELANLPAQITARERQASELYVRFSEALARNDRNTAQTFLDQALAIWVDNQQYIDQRNQHFRETRPGERAADGSQPCTASLAGLGTATRATCFDVVAGQRAPTLVVVPAAAGGRPFAIGKYEVAVVEFNHFCRTTGQCQPLAGDAALPATNISIQSAEAYVAWLSSTTERRYRIPTEAEWAYAAGGGGNPGSSADSNCRVVQGGNVIKGASLTRVNVGMDNGWGLRNHVGNAQEWVRAGGTLLARGGAHSDTAASCDVSLSKPHSGAADSITGFRVARDLE